MSVPRAAPLLLALLILLTPLASAVPLERALAGARFEEVVVLRPGVYEGPAVLSRDLLVQGPLAEGAAVLVGRPGPEPGVVIVDAPGNFVSLRHLSIEDARDGVRVGAATLELRDVSFRNVTTPLRTGPEAAVLYTARPGEGPVPPAVRNAGPGLFLIGHVVPLHLQDEAGNPVAGALVTLHAPDGRRLGAWRSGEDGNAAPFAPHEESRSGAPPALSEGYTFRIEAPGRAPATLPAPSLLPSGPQVVTLAAEASPSPGLSPATTAALVGGASLGALALAAWAVLQSENRLWRLLLLALPLYTRLAPGKLLDQSRREAVYRFLQEHPGAHYRQIQRTLDLPNGVLAHHLNLLVRERYVREDRHGMYRRFYPVGTEPLPPPPDAAEELLAFLRRRPGMTAKETALHLGRSPSLLSYHVKRLEEQGRLERRKAGREVHLFVVEGTEARSTRR